MSGIPYAEVIGDPIAHSKSPLIHKFWLEKLGMEGDYRHCLVRPGELGTYFERRRHDPDWRGCNITMPHKLAALEHVHKPQDPIFPVEPINIALTRNGRIEGAGGQLLECVEGSHFAVLGVPLVPLFAYLRERGVIPS